MTFDLKQLKAFEAVARTGGFSRASQEIGLTQPTLSTHIRNLENNLGVRLFDRAPRSVTLTPTGVLLADYARRILDLYDESLEAIVAFTGSIKGSVMVEASTVPGEYLLPRWLAGFQKRYPDVQVQLGVSDSGSVLEKVERGDITLGVTGSPGDQPGLLSEKLCDDHIVLVVPAALVLGGRSPGTGLEGISGLPLIRREPGSGTQLAIENALRSGGVDPDSLKWTATLGSTRAVIEGVLSGLGGAFLSHTAVSREIMEGLLREEPVPGLTVSRGFYLVRHRQRTLSPAAACFYEELLRAGPGLDTRG